MLSEFQNALGSNAVLSVPDDMQPYLREWRGLFEGKALAVVRPSTTQQVSDAVKLACAHGLKIIPQGGNTGLVGGQMANDAENHIILSTDRLNAIRNLDSDGNSITAEAGVVLERIQQAASDADRFFP
ncbi:MAG: FAD-binding oxidoreductase, partial [Hyphomicrobiales bacterium]